MMTISLPENFQKKDYETYYFSEKLKYHNRVHDRPHIEKVQDSNKKQFPHIC